MRHLLVLPFAWILVVVALSGACDTGPTTQEQVDKLNAQVGDLFATVGQLATAYDDLSARVDHAERLYVNVQTGLATLKDRFDTLIEALGVLEEIAAELRKHILSEHSDEMYEDPDQSSGG